MISAKECGCMSRLLEIEGVKRNEGSFREKGDKISKEKGRWKGGI